MLISDLLKVERFRYYNSADTVEISRDFLLPHGIGTRWCG